MTVPSYTVRPSSRSTSCTEAWPPPALFTAISLALLVPIRPLCAAEEALEAVPVLLDAVGTGWLEDFAYHSRKRPVAASTSNSYRTFPLAISPSKITRPSSVSWSRETSVPPGTRARARVCTLARVCAPAVCAEAYSKSRCVTMPVSGFTAATPLKLGVVKATL